MKQLTMAELQAGLDLIGESPALIARDEEHWPLAGDQLYVDLSLADSNIPPGTRLTIVPGTIRAGDAVRKAGSP